VKPHDPGPGANDAHATTGQHREELGQAAGDASEHRWADSLLGGAEALIGVQPAKAAAENLPVRGLPPILLVEIGAKWVSQQWWQRLGNEDLAARRHDCTRWQFRQQRWRVGVRGEYDLVRQNPLTRGLDANDAIRCHQQAIDRDTDANLGTGAPGRVGEGVDDGKGPEVAPLAGIGGTQDRRRQGWYQRPRFVPIQEHDIVIAGAALCRDHRREMRMLRRGGDDIERAGETQLDLGAKLLRHGAEQIEVSARQGGDGSTRGRIGEQRGAAAGHAAVASGSTRGETAPLQEQHPLSTLHQPVGDRAANHAATDHDHVRLSALPHHHHPYRSLSQPSGGRAGETAGRV